eukprot:SAG31_NODE_232_length_19710_cov_17.109581_18_plen_102_part_00
MYNFNTLAVHENFIALLEESQGAGGDIPVVIPSGNPGPGSCGDIAWTAAYPLLTQDLYMYYGDMRVLKIHWPSLVRYVENLISTAERSPHRLAQCDQFQGL